MSCVTSQILFRIDTELRVMEDKEGIQRWTVDSCLNYRDLQRFQEKEKAALVESIGTCVKFEGKFFIECLCHNMYYMITSLGMGLSITLRAGRGILRWLWGAVAQWSELKQEALGLIPGGYPGVFLFQLAYTNANG